MAILTVPTNDEFRAFFRAYGADGPGDDAAPRGIDAGTVNTSFAIDAGGAPRFFLRIYEAQDEAGARAEALLLAHLSARGVPTPEPLAARDGAVVRALAGKPAVLFPWVDGTMLCQKSVSAAAAEALGRALARIHEVGAPPSGALGPGRFGPDELVRRCDRVATSRDPEARLLADALRRSVETVARVRSETLPSGLVHADLFRDNVLWRTSELVALLDFESAHHGPFVFDLAVTLLSWSFDDTFVPEIARALVAGYRTVRELGDDEREALFDEARFASLRFTITRITDETARIGKRWQRFVARTRDLEALGPRGFRELVGL